MCLYVLLIYLFPCLFVCFYLFLNFCLIIYNLIIMITAFMNIRSILDHIHEVLAGMPFKNSTEGVPSLSGSIYPFKKSSKYLTMPNWKSLLIIHWPNSSLSKHRQHINICVLAKSKPLEGTSRLPVNITSYLWSSESSLESIFVSEMRRGL